MPGNEQQIMQLYMAVTGLLSFLSLVMYLVCAIVVLANGRASIERTLIGIGAALQAIGVALSLGIMMFQKGFQQGAPQLTIYLFYGLSNLIAFAGTVMGFWGAVKLLNRAAQMELLLEDPDDEH